MTLISAVSISWVQASQNLELYFRVHFSSENFFFRTFLPVIIFPETSLAASTLFRGEKVLKKQNPRTVFPVTFLNCF